MELMDNKRKKLIWTVLAFAGAALIFNFPASGQSGTNPYQQWSMEEVQKLLSDSPWAQTHDLGFVSSTATAGSVSLRLRSALPLRQALVRLRQLKAKYDKMSDHDKAAFDEKNKPLLDCPACDDNYVVALSPGPGGPTGMPTSLQTMSEAQAKLNFQLLNDAGEKRELVHFIPPKFQGEDAVFFFARFDEKGKPLLTSQSKTLIVSLGPKLLGDVPIPKTAFTFEVSKMILNGKVLF